jgi:type I restriction enzyme S subunit
LNRLCLEPGDVLMNEGGDYDKLGRGCIWSGQIHPCITQNHVFAVRPRSVSSEWLNLYTSSRAAQFYFMSRSKQSTNLASISSTNLMELPVPLPPRSEQQVVVDLVTARLQKLDVMNSESAQAIALLQERRAALIAAAVTGQIDVRGWGPPEAA